MTFPDTLLLAGLVILAYMVSIWLVSLAIRDASIVDIFWGPGFLIVGWAVFLAVGNQGPRAVLMLALVTTWGLRLGLYLLSRNWGKGEDFRYAKWREEGGSSWWWRSFFKVNALQGVVMFIVVMPVVYGIYYGGEVGVLDALAALVWGVGFIFESVGDWQLTRFKADPANKGKVMDSGLWRYTRHPNYFGDAVVWWGHYLVALAAGGWWTIFSPVLMNFLLMRVSGVAMLEKSLKESKPKYADYIRRTSAFFPLPPKSE